MTQPAMVDERPSRNRDDKVYCGIRDGIMTGRYPPGSRLVESRLAEEFGVSRTRVRNGLARLDAELLVAPSAGRGLIVRPLSTREIEEGYALRLLLEGYGAGEAARNITVVELTKLKEINNSIVSLEQEGQGSTGDARRSLIIAITDLNSQFHGLLQSASRNSRLRQLVRTVVEVPLVFRSFYWYSDVELEAAASDHERILSALTEGDGDAAEGLMRSHITGGLNTLLRELPGYS